MGQQGVSYGQNFDETKRLAEQGDAEAQRELGGMYFYGEGIPEDHTEGVKWWRLAAVQGDALAQRELGSSFKDGEGVFEDDAEAVKWYRLAAEQGDALAQRKLGVMYFYGEGVPADHTEAVKWYRLAAEQGFTDAQYNLGVMYENGDGVPEDDKQAVKWYRLAAEQEHGPSYNALGVSFDEGIGVERDEIKAVYYYEEAVKLGFTDAYCNLALFYENKANENISVDLRFQEYEEKALSYFKAAADNGFPRAYFALAEYYRFGRGTEVSVEMQLESLDRAIANGFNEALITKAETLRALGNYFEAESLLLKALSEERFGLGSEGREYIWIDEIFNINTSTGEKTDPTSLYYNDLKTELSSIYFSQGRTDEAIALQRQIIKETELLYGADSLALAGDMTNLSIELCADNFYDEGRGYLEQARLIYLKSLGDEDTWLYANLLGNLGFCETDEIKSEAYYVEAIAMFERMSNDQERAGLFTGNLADDRGRRGQIDLARQGFAKAISYRPQNSEEQIIGTMDLMADYSAFEINQSNFVKACEIIKPSYEVFVRKSLENELLSGERRRPRLTSSDIALIYASCLGNIEDNKESSNEIFEALQFSRAYTVDRSLEVSALSGHDSSGYLKELVSLLRDKGKERRFLIQDIGETLSNNSENIKFIEKSGSRVAEISQIQRIFLN